MNISRARFWDLTAVNALQRVLDKLSSAGKTCCCSTATRMLIRLRAAGLCAPYLSSSNVSTSAILPRAKDLGTRVRPHCGHTGRDTSKALPR